MSRLIVGITGYRRCGKDSVAAILVRRYGFVRHGFADALRDMALAVNPVIVCNDAPMEYFDKFGSWARYSHIIDQVGYEKAKGIPDFRRFLQRLGAEGVRATFGANAWIDALARRIEHTTAARIAISDVRFQSEADWVHAQGGTMWRVIRPGYGGDDVHASERDVPSLPCDSEIVANDLLELETGVMRVVGDITDKLMEAQ
jgi:hypothetical protein